jgi:N,N'-diacetyllegionaminate synthase
MARTFVIAEAGSCHDLDIEKAYQMVEVAALAGASALKLQYWSSAERMAQRRHAMDYLPVYRRYQVPFDWLGRVKGRCQDHGIEFMCSTYLPEDVWPVSELVRTMKVASFEANDRPHLAAHLGPLAVGRRVLVSCGLGADPLFVLHHLRVPDPTVGNVALLHCVSAYPAPLDQLQLARIRPDALRAYRFDGFSDHSLPNHVDTGALAVAAGARIVERHFRLDSTDKRNPDAPHAMSPAGLAEYVALIRAAEAALGDGWAGVQECEAPMRAYRVRAEEGL